MDVNQKIVTCVGYKNPDSTDEIGACFRRIDEGGTHYYRQDKNRVLHINVTDGALVNTLRENHIEFCRQNFGEEFEKVDKKIFEGALRDTLVKIYEQ
jgi:hypothetical protein